MKKVIVAILIIAAATLAYNWYHSGGQTKLANFEQYQVPQLAQDIQKQISTPGPLRGQDNARHPQLSTAGVFDLTNQRRVRNNLPFLNHNTLLDADAAAKVHDMFSQQYFEHISPQGKGPADLAAAYGYVYLDIGENLALGNFQNDQALVQAWMNSPGHRANILGAKYTDLGVAVGQGMFEGHETWLAVQEFGRPTSACPNVDANLKAQINGGQSELASLQTQIQQLKNQLDAGRPQTQEEVNVYNQQVSEYNDLIKIYNNRIDALKSLFSQYNAEVNVYNLCLAN